MRRVTRWAIADATKGQNPSQRSVLDLHGHSKASRCSVPGLSHHQPWCMSPCVTAHHPTSPVLLLRPSETSTHIIVGRREEIPTDNGSASNTHYWRTAEPTHLDLELAEARADASAQCGKRQRWVACNCTVSGICRSKCGAWETLLGAMAAGAWALRCSRSHLLDATSLMLVPSIPASSRVQLSQQRLALRLGPAASISALYE